MPFSKAYLNLHLLQNSNCFVFLFRAGLVLQSVVRADTSFVRSRVEYTVATEAALHFTSDINFYDGVLMCLKLTQPEFAIR